MATMIPTVSPSPIIGYSNDGTQAEFTMAPMLVTLAPASQKPPKKGLSALEIMLIAMAVAIGVVTLCVLLSVSKQK